MNVAFEAPSPIKFVQYGHVPAKTCLFTSSNEGRREAGGRHVPLQRLMIYSNDSNAIKIKKGQGSCLYVEYITT